VKVLASTPARAAAERLLALYDAACARGLRDVLSADAGEVRGFAYYTGMTFAIFAEGPGEPIGGGGRYDELLARFGAELPAVGLGIDIDALAWALRVAVPAEPRRDGVVVVGPPDDPRLASLRARGIPAVAVNDAKAAEAYAASWGFERVLEP
jgi:ATP phosphoribosyltransferase regulatory subunit